MIDATVVSTERARGAARSLVVVLFVVLSGTAPAFGQVPAPADPEPVQLGAGEGLDEHVLIGIYEAESPLFRGAMRGANATAYPVFFGAPVAAWGGAWLLREERDSADASRLTVTAAGTYGLVKGIKLAVGRPRPYAAVDGLASRARRYRPGAQATYESFPSGHAAVSFALAASYSLSHPQWYVIAPAAVWAAGVSVSRPWLGGHYPSAVLAGALLGTGVAVAVHVLGPHITPHVLRGEPDASREPDPRGAVLAPMVLLLRVPL